MNKTDAQLYEELRDAIDCGSESMTHQDALEWIWHSHYIRSNVTADRAEGVCAACWPVGVMDVSGDGPYWPCYACGREEPKP
jgi:hypothetical protein